MTETTENKEPNVSAEDIEATVEAQESTTEVVEEVVGTAEVVDENEVKTLQR